MGGLTLELWFGQVDGRLTVACMLAGEEYGDGCHCCDS
jgi:hypothetical protein